MKRSCWWLVGLGSGLLMAACSSTPGTNGTVQPSSPFTAELAHVFDDSVDYVENIEGLGGRLAQEWRRQIEGLVQHSDLVAVVHIETVTTGSDNSGARSYRLTATGQTRLRGRFPHENRVDLNVGEGGVGFNTIRGNESRLQSRDYVLFAKWYTDADHQVRAHWHLTPSSAGLLQQVRDAMGTTNPDAPRETVVRQE